MKKLMRPCCCLLQIILLSLIPADSWAKTKKTGTPALTPAIDRTIGGSPTGKLDKRSLSLDELQDLIGGFEATIIKERKGRTKKESSRTIVYGQIFPDCIQHLEPVAHDNPNEGKGNCVNTVGFEFLDMGGEFKKCVERHHKKRPAETCETLKCISLSEYEKKPFSFPLQDNYDSHVGFKHMFTNNLKDIHSKDRFQCEDFPDAPLIHESTKLNEMTRRKENTEKEENEKFERDARDAANKEKKEQEHAENIDYLKKQICVNCKSHKDLEEAIQANEKLRSLQEIGDKLGIVTLNQGEFEKNQKQFHEAGLNLLFAEIASAPLEQLDGLSEKLLEWAKSHPKDAEKVAIAGLKPLADRLASNPHANPNTFEAASELVGHARKLTSNSKAKAEFARKLEDLKIRRIVSMAHYGLQRNPYNFTREYTQLIRETEQQAWKVCYGFQANLEECADVLKLRSIVTTLPQIAQAADMQGSQAQVGLQQALHPEQFGIPAGMNSGVAGMQHPVNLNNPAAAAMNPPLAVNPMAAMNPAMGMNSMYSGMHNIGSYNPMVPMNPMGGYNQMNSMMGGYNQMNPMMGGGYNQMNPMMGGGYNQMNPMMGGGYNQMNPMMGGYNQMNPMMGGYNQMNPMMGGGYNQMNPMMGGYNQMNPTPAPH